MHYQNTNCVRIRLSQKTWSSDLHDTCRLLGYPVQCSEIGFLWEPRHCQEVGIQQRYQKKKKPPQPRRASGNVERKQTRRWSPSRLSCMCLRKRTAVATFELQVIELFPTAIDVYLKWNRSPFLWKRQTQLIAGVRSLNIQSLRSTRSIHISGGPAS